MRLDLFIREALLFLQENLSSFSWNINGGNTLMGGKVCITPASSALYISISMYAENGHIFAYEIIFSTEKLDLAKKTFYLEKMQKDTFSVHQLIADINGMTSVLGKVDDLSSSRSFIDESIHRALESL